MNLSQEKALYYLTGQTEINHRSQDTIQQLSDAYPYFAPAQCLLAYQFKKDEHPMVVLQTLKTALYFTNPYWLQYQLLDDGISRPKFKGEEAITLPLHEPVTANPEPTTHQEPAPVVSFTKSIDIPTVEAVKEMMRNIDPAPASVPGEIITDAVPELEKEETFPEIETNASNEKISSLLSGQLEDFKKPVAPDAKLDIDSNGEQLFTVDYFASLGIIVDLTKIPQDKLTTHLLKFTDWLKQVKHGEVNPKSLVANFELEQAVVQTAQNSNQKREILTETMAEVLVKQGLTDKAIQLYKKLSFLNPEKSSYFAFKIEQLKEV